MWLYNIFLQAFLSSFKLLCIDDSQESQHYFNKRRFRLIRYDSVYIYIYIWNGLICNDRMVIVKESKQVYSTWKKERKKANSHKRKSGRLKLKNILFFFCFFFWSSTNFSFHNKFCMAHSLTHSLTHSICVMYYYMCVCDPNGGNTHSLSNFVSLSILLKKKTLVIFLNEYCLSLFVYIYILTITNNQQLTTNH